MKKLNNSAEKLRKSVIPTKRKRVEGSSTLVSWKIPRLLLRLTSFTQDSLGMTHDAQQLTARRFKQKIKNMKKFALPVSILLLIILAFYAGMVIMESKGKTKVRKAPAIERKVNANESLVEIRGSNFYPVSVKVTSRKIVIFRNRDDVVHRVSSDTYPEFKSPDIYPNSEFTFVFVKPGTWSIYLDDNKGKTLEVEVN